MHASNDHAERHNPLDDKLAPHPMARRWVPYKHSNGVALYLHEPVTHEEGVGGEYMASQVVRGTPQQCLTALTHLSSTTTVIGPAMHVEVLQHAQDAQVRSSTAPLQPWKLCTVCVMPSWHGRTDSASACCCMASSRC